MTVPTDYIEDEVFGQRLLISVNADKRELRSNIRAARAILHSFSDVTIIINAHTFSFGIKILNIQIPVSWATAKV